MRARSNLPAAGIHFRAAIPEGFGVARGNEGRERAPNSGFSEKGTVFEFGGLADAVEDEANVVAAVAPDFVQPAQREAGGLVEFHRCPNGDVRYSVARAVGFAENVGVAVVGSWFAVVTQASEHGGAAFALVGPFAERVMQAIGDGDHLRDARRDGAHHGVTDHGWRCLASPRTWLRGRGE